MTVWGPEWWIGWAFIAWHLSRREREVALLTLAGMDAQQIADALYIEPRTVVDHRTSVYRKAGVRSASGLGALRLAAALRRIGGTQDAAPLHGAGCRVALRPTPRGAASWVA